MGRKGKTPNRKFGEKRSEGKLSKNNAAAIKRMRKKEYIQPEMVGASNGDDEEGVQAVGCRRGNDWGVATSAGIGREVGIKEEEVKKLRVGWQLPVPEPLARRQRR